MLFFLVYVMRSDTSGVFSGVLPCAISNGLGGIGDIAVCFRATSISRFRMSFVNFSFLMLLKLRLVFSTSSLTVAFILLLFVVAGFRRLMSGVLDILNVGVLVCVGSDVGLVK